MTSCDIVLERLRRSTPPNEDSIQTQADVAAAFGKRFTSLLVNIARIWPPECIPLIHPLMCCCIVNPWASASPSDVRGKELSKLFLSHCSKFWGVGDTMLREQFSHPERLESVADRGTISPFKGLRTIINGGGDLDAFTPGSEERTLLQRYWILYPDAQRKRNPVASGQHGSQPSPVEQRGSRSQDRPSPSRTGFGSPSDAFWDLGLWGDMQGLDPDGGQSELMTTPSFDTVLPGPVRGAGNRIDQVLLDAIPDATNLAGLTNLSSPVIDFAGIFQGF